MSSSLHHQQHGSSNHGHGHGHGHNYNRYNSSFVTANNGESTEYFPKRVFVGGFSTSTTEEELKVHFEKFFNVREVKVIRTAEGVSKGYGFITFDTADEAQAVMNMPPQQLEMNGRKINIGPAYRKGSRYSAEYAMATPSGQVLSSPSMNYSYHYPTSAPSSAPATHYHSYMYSPGAGMQQSLLTSPSQSAEDSMHLFQSPHTPYYCPPSTPVGQMGGLPMSPMQSPPYFLGPDGVIYTRIVDPMGSQMYYQSQFVTTGGSMEGSLMAQQGGFFSGRMPYGIGGLSPQQYSLCPTAVTGQVQTEEVTETVEGTVAASLSGMEGDVAGLGAEGEEIHDGARSSKSYASVAATRPSKTIPALMDLKTDARAISTLSSSIQSIIIVNDAPGGPGGDYGEADGPDDVFEEGCRAGP